ncbi:MAG: hypothetical protein AB1472_04900 [Candidatus Omnitrophota bacterium]
MKAFLIGLIFLMAVVILSGIGVLIFPLILAMAIFLKIIVSICLVLFAIWLLGKFIIFIWEKIFNKSK